MALQRRHNEPYGVSNHGRLDAQPFLQAQHLHSGWTPFHPMYENSTLCTKWFVHQANTAGTFIVHQANATGAFIVHQGNDVEHIGSYIAWQNGVYPRWLTRVARNITMTSFAMASQITSVSIVCPTLCSRADQRKHQNSATLASVREIHRCPVDFPH